MPNRGGKSSRPKASSGTSAQDAAKRLVTAHTKPRLRIGTRLRNYFLTGLIIVGPLTITLWIVWWGINVIDAWVKPLVPDAYLPGTYLSYPIPGAGLLFAIIGLTIIGALAANLLGRTIISYGELVLGRMPVVRNVYAGLKQIFETVLSKSSSSFQKVGLIEYPREGLYSIVFISTDARGEIAVRWQGETPLVSVFLPTTPNPTSGYLLFVPSGDVTELDMSVEEAAKLVISAGLVTPPYDDGWVQAAAAQAPLQTQAPVQTPGHASAQATGQSPGSEPGAGDHPQATATAHPTAGAPATAPISRAAE